MKLKHKILFTVAVILAIASWAISICYWSKLPDIIPTHFGISGQPDSWSDKSLLSVFMIPVLQSILTTSFVALYYKPQYSNMPTTMWLMTLDKGQRERAFSLIRTMLVGTSLWIGALFTYLTYGMNVAALNDGQGLSSLLMLLLIGFMLIWLAYWTIRVYKSTKKSIADETKSHN